ncbi:MAG TPA: ROK family protein [Bryobacteraceae bacterium]|nr:ROK family protein [Bryobacteraceae bacterium]
MLALGGIEAGGTKFVCAAGHPPDDLELAEIPTTTPEQTISRVLEFFKARPALRAIGIASFGPVDLDPSSSTCGFITWTPKLAWRNFDFAGSVRKALRVPVAFDTDVNAAALAEGRWGAAQGLDTFLYLTVGTGIGGGGMANGRLLHGRTHPEMGHVRVPHDMARDPFPGNCPYHGDCLEGLAAAPAIQTRWGQDPSSLPDSHPAWDLEARYLALGLVNAICVLSPQRIILGGGVMTRQQLFPMIRGNVAELLNGYVDAPDIVPPSLGSRAGVLGAMALADAILADSASTAGRAGVG